MVPRFQQVAAVARQGGAKALADPCAPYALLVHTELDPPMVCHAKPAPMGLRLAPPLQAPFILLQKEPLPWTHARQSAT